MLTLDGSGPELCAQYKSKRAPPIDTRWRAEHSSDPTQHLALFARLNASVFADSAEKSDAETSLRPANGVTQHLLDEIYDFNMCVPFK